jgi:hypothetical protein
MGQLPAQCGEFHMCQRCIEIEDKIGRYRRLTTLTDELTKERIAELIDDLKQEKAALHPEQQPVGREKRCGCV